MKSMVYLPDGTSLNLDEMLEDAKLLAEVRAARSDYEDLVFKDKAGIALVRLNQLRDKLELD